MAETKTARGAETRQKLLDAARRLFSERGFAGVSTRDLTRAAGATLPAIPHHFGSKEGLYRAVLLELAEELRTGIAPAAAAAQAVLARPDATHPELLAALEDLLSTCTRTVLQSKSEFARLMVQEQAQPTAASIPVSEVFAQCLTRPLQQLLARLRKLPPDNEEVMLQTLFLLGRFLIFRSAHTAASQLLGWPELTPARIEIIVATLRMEVRLLFAT